MKVIGNILWFILGGLVFAAISFVFGILCFISIIFIPVGFQQFKLANFFLWPMGRKVVYDKPSGFKLFCNIIWAILFGWIDMLFYGLIGVLFCITIIGIPFGIQYFKLARFILLPLGHDFVFENAKKE